jgi:hypothetical protein
MKNAIKSSENPLQEEIPSDKEARKEYTPPAHTGKEDNHHDDGEHFKLRIPWLIELSCKRVTVKVIIVIVIVLLCVVLIAKC